jgi:hypothetical protein
MKFHSFIFSILFLSIVLVQKSSGLWIIDSIRKFFSHSENVNTLDFEPKNLLSPVVFGKLIFGGVITLVIDFLRILYYKMLITLVCFVVKPE